MFFRYYTYIFYLLNFLRIHISLHYLYYFTSFIFYINDISIIYPLCFVVSDNFSCFPMINLVSLLERKKNLKMIILTYGRKYLEVTVPRDRT